MTEADFDAILAAARRGDETAWRTLHGSLAGPLLGYLRARGAPEPEDALGEVFVQLARHLHRFRGTEAALRGWAFQIARHRIIDQRRWRRRRPVEPVEESMLDAIAGNDSATTTGQDDDVARLLAPLTPDQQDVILLRVVADLSTADTARILGKRPAAVRQLQRRALAAMRRALAPAGDGEDHELLDELGAKRP